MLVVGLTGGAASGKSAVAHAFQKLSTPVIETDLIAKSLTAIGQPAYAAILKHFGPSICQADGHLNRLQLRTLIFDDPEAKTWLEHCLHPSIQASVLREYEAIRILDKSYLVVDIPLLTQHNRDHYQIDRVVVVDADPTIQIERLCARDSIPQGLAEKMIAQEAYTRKERLDFADHILHNEDSLDTLSHKTQALHITLNELAKGSFS
jgi:dephospho-CoA kinase